MAFTIVTKEVFYKFVKEYPNRLEADHNDAFGYHTLNDFTLGNWPESVVAMWSMTWYDDDVVTYKIRN
jgi:hypothetical protein